MDLKTTYIRMNCEKGKAGSQITLDEDYNLPDYKPDLVKVWKEHGDIYLDEVKAGDGHVYIKGNMQFQLLYRSDQPERRVDCLIGTIPFSETINLDEAKDLVPIQMKVEIEDLSISIINSRKLGVRALLRLQASVRESCQEEVAIGVSGEDGLQLKLDNKKVLQLVDCKKDNFRFRQEIVLPSSKDNIRDILWKTIQIRGLESRIQNGSISLQAEVLVYVLYIGDDEEGHLQWMETTVPMTGNVECGGCQEQAVHKLTAELRTAEIEVKPDFDGELRIMNLDMVLDLELCVWQEQDVQVLSDVYSLKEHMIPEYQECRLPELKAKNYAKCKINDQISVEQQKENILQLCTCEGVISIDEQTPTGNGVHVEGTIDMEIMYITADDAMPIGTVKGYLPFAQDIEVPQANDNTEYELDTGIDQLSALLIDNSHIEVKAVINLNLVAIQREKQQKVVAIETEELNMEELQKQPGIIGYLVAKGDDLWSIAKKYHTTIGQIMETNQLEKEEIFPGDKLLIVKTV